MHSEKVLRIPFSLRYASAVSSFCKMRIKSSNLISLFINIVRWNIITNYDLFFNLEIISLLVSQAVCKTPSS